MAKVYYCTHNLISGTQWLAFADAAPADGATSTQFQTSTTAFRAPAGYSANMDSQSGVILTAFTAPAKPSALDATNGNAWRSSTPLVGLMLPGTFTFTLGGIRNAGGANVNSVRYNFMLYKSPNANGSGATALTPSIVQTNASIASFVPVTYTATWNSTEPIILDNEYLFLAMACYIESIDSLANRLIQVYLGSAYGSLSTPDMHPLITELVGVVSG